MKLSEYYKELLECGYVSRTDDRKISIYNLVESIYKLEEIERRLYINDDTGLIEVVQELRERLCVSKKYSFDEPTYLVETEAKILMSLDADSRLSVPYGVGRYADVRRYYNE